MKAEKEKNKQHTDFLARTNEAEIQSLSEHLNNVADLSTSFSKYENISRLAGISHDFGKATIEFLSYLINGGKRGSVVHALQGAFFVDDICCVPSDVAGILVKEIVTLAIVAHHGSLNDGISPDGEKAFFQKLSQKDNKEYSYEEVKQNIAELSTDFTCDVNELFDLAKKDINSILRLIGETYKSQESAQFALGLFVKYIYSCLIDADRLDAYLFDVNEQYKPVITDWDSLINVFEKRIQEFSDESKIARIRKFISNQCKAAGEKSTGIYQLSVPTGGGKTLSSLRFALHHCKKENKKRIIYVIPYLSIIEQTALEIKEILNLPEENEIILECHSNIVLPDDQEDQVIRKLAASRWDKPIIVTTMVQFLETIMSSKGSDLRKFHNMSDAVIIFDEIQSLPIKSIHLFNEAATFLAKVCSTTILLCTATQPLLDKTNRENLLLESNPDLIDCSGLFEKLKRIRIVALEEKDIDGFSAFVLEKADINGNCLAIVNTKKSAREVFERLKGSHDFAVFHMSTSMCSIHRAKIIAKIKEALLDNRKIICVSTQLIECGINVSFSCVVRATAGLDSVTQAAGRCNRHGESQELKEVYVISLKDENLDKLADIKAGKAVTERLIRENAGVDLLDLAVMEQFYKYYFYDRKNLMDYPTKDVETVYEMLSFNDAGRRNYKNRTGEGCQCHIAQAFRTADENFYVIDKDAVSVVVIYGDAEKLIEAYHKQPKNRITREKLDIIRKLEKFSVSLYSWEMDKLADAVYDLDEETGIRILAENHYSEEVGVILETNPEDYMI